MTSRTHIVVPEGMNRPNHGGRDLAPAHDACVQRVALEAADGDAVYMSPGNAFGHPVPEDIAAAQRLRELRPELLVSEVITPRDRYLDTWDNAFRLREWAMQQSLWPLGDCWLYCHRYHAWRSLLCFRAAGFSIRGVRTAVAAQRDGSLPARLWYYDYPLAHVMYEALAILYTGIRALALAGRQIMPEPGLERRS